MKIVAVWQFTSHLTHLARMVGTVGEIRTTHNYFLHWTHTHGRTSVGGLAETYIHQLYADTGCHFDDLPIDTHTHTHSYTHIYIYIYILSLKKTKTGHIRIINLFPSSYGF